MHATAGGETIGKRIVVRVAAMCQVLGFAALALCEERAQARHLVMRFRDPGPPAVRQVEAKIGDCSNGEWAWVPAKISRTGQPGVFEATVEMPDAQCAIFRVKRLSSDPVPELQIAATEVRDATGPISPFDHALVESYANDDLRDLPRFQERVQMATGPSKSYAEMIPYVDYLPGYVSLGFLEKDAPWPE